MSNFPTNDDYNKIMTGKFYQKEDLNEELICSLRALAEQYNVKAISANNANSFVVKAFYNLKLDDSKVDKLSLVTSAMKLIVLYEENISSDINISTLYELADYSQDDEHIFDHDNKLIRDIALAFRIQNIDDHIKVCNASISKTEIKYHKTVASEMLANEILTVLTVMKYLGIDNYAKIKDIIDSDTYANSVRYLLCDDYSQYEAPQSDINISAVNHMLSLVEMLNNYKTLTSKDSIASEDTISNAKKSIDNFIPSCIKYILAMMENCELSYLDVDKTIYDIHFNKYHNSHQASDLFESIISYHNGVDSMFTSTEVKPASDIIRDYSRNNMTDIIKMLKRVITSNKSNGELINSKALSAIATLCICICDYKANK